MPATKNTLTAKHVTSGVVSFLKKTNQSHLLPQVAKEVAKRSHAQLDPNTAIIESPVLLTPIQLNSLKHQLSAIFNRDLEIDNRANPQLIAGLLIKVGDHVIDQSINARINQLAKNFNL